MKKAIIAVVVMLFAAFPYVHAQPPGGRFAGERMKERQGQLRDALNLTDQQEAQMKKLRLDLERKQAQVQSKIRMARLDVKEIYLSDKLDRQAIEKAMKQVSDLQYQGRMNRVDFWFSVNGILTPEQQKAWKHHVIEMGGEMKERLRGSMRHRGGMMHGPPDSDME